MRDLKQAYRTHGLKLFGLPLVVVLVLAVLFDRSLDPYLDRRAQALEGSLKVERYKAVLERQSNIEKALADVQPQITQNQVRWLRASDGAQAGEQLAQQIRTVLSGLYFDVQDVSVKETPKTDMGPVLVEARFFGVPQQLPRLEATLALGEKNLQLKGLNINVVPDPQRGGQQLEIRAVLSGYFLKSDPPPVPPSGKPAPKK